MTQAADLPFSTQADRPPRAGASSAALRLSAYCALVALSYFALASVGLSFLVGTGEGAGGVAAVWPANGLTLAALMLAPRQWWPALLLAGVVGNVPASLLAGRTVAASALFAGVNAAEVLAAAQLMRWAFRRPAAFGSAREVVVFAVFACAGGGVLGGLAAATAVQAIAPGSAFLSTWRLWAVVDGLGLLTVAPVIVTVVRHRPFWRTPARLAEKLLCLGSFTAWCWMVFEGSERGGFALLQMPYVTMLPFLLWAGLRFDSRATSLLTLIMVCIGAWSTVHGRGPIIGHGYPLVDSIIGFQVSAMLWSLSALVLSAVMAERREAAAALVASEARSREAEAQARWAESQARDALSQARAAERAATESHARVQAIFDNAAAVIFMKDLDGRYLAVNRSFERDVGRSAAEVVGRTNQELFPGTMADLADAKDAEVLRTGEPAHYEIQSTLDGVDRVFWMIKFPVRSADGTVIAICGISTDITARKRAERELEAARDAAQESARRAEALAWRAESANRAKTEFLANVSHEIRTPLTAIFGYADLLLAPGVTPDERHDHVQTVRRNGEHLLSILNDLLDMSKIEAGRMTVERVPTSVPQVVADVLALMRQRAVEKGLDLDVACPTPVPAVVSGDPTRLRQILINLVGNAVKFTEAGSVRVDAWVDESGPRPELVFDVTDTGIGMTAEQVAAIGQPFTQGDPSHARRFGGSGLGLSICSRLAQLMDGALDCRSQPGVGSTFSLRLPAGDLRGVERVTDLRGGPAAAHAATAHAAAAVAAVPDEIFAAGRVLVAEDAPDTRRLLLTFLKRAGIESEWAENGQAAVARAMGAWRSGKPYNVIVMDVQMPQMDGLTATGVLRGHGYPGCILALTANAMDQDRQRCLAAGCNAFLTKPIRGPAFLSEVGRYLGLSIRHPRAAPSRKGEAETEPPFPGGAASRHAAVAEARPPRRLTSELEGDPDVGPLLGEYVRELRDKADAVRAAVDSHNWTSLARLAHQIKGSAGGYGYPTLSEAGAALERAARDGHDGVPAAAQALIDLCADATSGTP